MADRTHKANICWDCLRCSCPWLDEHEPVPGWTAEPSTIWTNYGGGMKKGEQSWHITACPLFVPAPPRKKSKKELPKGSALRRRRTP